MVEEFEEREKSIQNLEVEVRSLRLARTGRCSVSYNDLGCRHLGTLHTCTYQYAQNNVPEFQKVNLPVLAHVLLGFFSL